MSSKITTAGDTSDQPIASSEPSPWAAEGAMFSSAGPLPVISLVGNGVPRLFEHFFYLGNSCIECRLRLLATSRGIIDGNRNHLANIEIVAQASPPHPYSQRFAKNIVKIRKILLQRRIRNRFFINGNAAGMKLL